MSLRARRKLVVRPAKCTVSGSVTCTCDVIVLSPVEGAPAVPDTPSQPRRNALAGQGEGVNKTENNGTVGLRVERQ